jgi:hypothetical protein
MPDDFEGYRDTVLDAARRANNVPPPDLFTRYNLDPRQVRDEPEFNRRVELVVKYWQKLKLQRKYQPLATALLSADGELKRKKQRTYENFEQQRGNARGAAQDKLDVRVAAIAESTPCITLAALRRLVGSLDGSFGEDEVRAALKQRQVSIVEPKWELVGAPSAGGARSLRAPLTTLGLRLSPEVLFGDQVRVIRFTLRKGFRLTDGRTVTLDALSALREDHSRSKHDDRKTAIDNVLSILIKVAEQGDLDQLVLWEVQEHLRPDVDAGLPVRVIARAAQDIGLDADESLALAATLIGTREVVRDDSVLAKVAEALRSGDLREAAVLLADVADGEGEDVRTQLAQAQRQVDDLVHRAEAAMAAGDGEEAASLLTAAAQFARDDETLQPRVNAIAPPPPTEPTVSRQSGKVALRWTPSPARTPGIRYVVVRSTDEAAVSVGGGERVGETESNEMVDAEPTAAEPTYYTVFAARGHGAWSSGAAVGPVDLLPEVADVVLSAATGSVSGQWRAHPAAVEVVVTRTDRAASGAPPYVVPLPESGTPSFVDRDVVDGHTYDYLFQAVYVTRSRQRRTSDPVVVPVTPTEPPGSITELTHEVVPGPSPTGLRLVWRAPARGTVEVRIAADPPTWPVDTLVDRAAARSHGNPVSGEPVAGADGTTSMTVPVPQGRMVLTAFVVSGNQARVGASLTLSLVEPVTDLRTERFGGQLRLRWAWPDGANLARITWYPSGTDSRITGRQVDITRQAYMDGGGSRVDVGSGALTVSVVTVVRDRGEEQMSPASTGSVPGEPVRVTYGVRQGGRFTRRQDLVLSANRSCRLPGLLVVHRTDGIMPLRLGSGAIVARIEPRDLTPGIPVSVPLTDRIQPLSGLACFVAPDSPPADEVTLVSAPVG